MRTSEKTNKAMVSPLKGAIGKTVTEIKAQDNLKYWEIHLEDGTKLAFDDCGSDKQIYCSHLCSNGKPTQTWQNVQDEPTAESGSAKPAEAANEPQAGGGSAPSPCSASEAFDKQITQSGPEDAWPGASKGDWCASSRKKLTDYLAFSES